jgi:hypothetical protein
MGGVPSKHLAQVSLAEDQHPVGDLGPDRQDKTLGEAVRSWTARRIFTTSMPASASTASKEAAN